MVVQNNKKWYKVLQFIVATIVLAYAPAALAAGVAGQNTASAVIRLRATMKPSESNFIVDTFRFATSDKRICPAGGSQGCTYRLDRGEWVVYMQGNSPGYLLQGTMKATDGTDSRFFQLRADLKSILEQFVDGHKVQNLAGMVNFNNGTLNYGVTMGSLDISNYTLTLVGSAT
jgi:hypothetical protein